MKKLLFLLSCTALFLSGISATVAHEMKGMPQGAVKLSGIVPMMGEHWANPKDMPTGPIFGRMHDKTVFIEYMLTQEDMKLGKSWTELPVPSGYGPINHMDIEFQPEGHEGFTVPHYDIHMYLVSHGEHMGY